jgi:N-acetylglucosamine kinase-like BadF-type ATPase
MRCILAIDAGGSKCDALLVRDDCTVMGYGYVDVNDPASGRGRIGSGRSFKSISHAVRQAIGDTVCDELILVGFSKTLPPINVRDIHVDCIRMRSVSEQDPAFV